jgi:hypothetical protein
MFACLFFGDSLALGTGMAVNALLPRACEIRAAEGASSMAMMRWTPSPRRYGTTILSVGSNDDIGPATPPRLRLRAVERITNLRSHPPSHRYIWLLPYDRSRAALVRRIAATFGDEILDLARFPSRDGIHPASYRTVAGALLR